MSNFTSPKVSVIVPIYNVAHFITRCAHSLMRQTLREVEYIFINDCTPDNSMEILEKVISQYPDRKDDITIINHVKNLGLPSARNTGLRAAKGIYIYHCDSDDYIDVTILERLYESAVINNADFVWCDFYATSGDFKQLCCQKAYLTSRDAVRGVLQGELAFNVWNKLLHRRLYTSLDINFPTGYSMGEDMTMIMLLARAKKVAYVPHPLYYYVRNNATALTRQGLKPIHIEALYHNLSRTVKDISCIYGDIMNDALAAFQLQVKWLLLVDGSYKNFQLWRKWSPNTHSYIWKYRHTQSNFRIKLIEWFAAKGQFWLVWIHYQVVIRFYTNWLKKKIR